MNCLAEFCINWTGDGCICEIMGLEPVEAEHNAGCGCKKCYDNEGEEMYDAGLY